MTARSPWRLGELPVVFGEELPALLNHHPRPQPWFRTHRWRPIDNTGAGNKPRGGLWTAPAILPEGKWRPIPRRSEWTAWCEGEMPHWINGTWQTQIHPEREAVFARIDSGDDARLLYEHFPNDDHPVAVALREAGSGTRMFEKMIDWSALMGRGISGVYLTDRGQVETRLPDTPGVPSLYGWDLATVWFSRPAFRPGRTWKARPVDLDPYDMGWDEDYWKPEAARERLRAAAEDARRYLAERQGTGESGE